MNEILISAVIPNYNHAKLLPRSVGSFLSQTVPPLEIIVVDDASTDNSLEVLNELAAKHSIIRIIRNEKNLGVNASVTRGLEQTRGNYFITLAADDEVRSGLIEQATGMLREHPEAGFFSGIVEIRCTGTGLNWTSGTGMPNHECYLSPSDMVSLGRRGKLVVSGPCAVFKKSALIDAGGWVLDVRWYSDWFALCAVGFRHGMCHSPKVLANFYLFPGSYFNATARNYAERRATMAKVLDLLASRRYAEVGPRIRRSGYLGYFGWSMFRVVLSNPKHWNAFTIGFAAQLAKRTAEIIGRKFFPNWLAKACLRIFYGRR